MRTVFSFALGAAAGAAAAHFLDPDSGRKRRNHARAQASTKASTAASAVSTQAHHAAGTMKGVAHAVTPHRHEEMDDMTLADRVRSEIFRDHDAPKGERLRRRPGRRRLPARRGRRPGLDRALRLRRAQGPGHHRRQEPAARARHADAGGRAAVPGVRALPLLVQGGPRRRCAALGQRAPPSGIEELDLAGVERRARSPPGLRLARRVEARDDASTRRPGPPPGRRPPPARRVGRSGPRRRSRRSTRRAPSPSTRRRRAWP